MAKIDFNLSGGHGRDGGAQMSAKIPGIEGVLSGTRPEGSLSTSLDALSKLLLLQAEQSGMGAGIFGNTSLSPQAREQSSRNASAIQRAIAMHMQQQGIQPQGMMSKLQRSAVAPSPGGQSSSPQGGLRAPSISDLIQMQEAQRMQRRQDPFASVREAAARAAKRYLDMDSPHLLSSLDK